MKTLRSRMLIAALPEISVGILCQIRKFLSHYFQISCLDWIWSKELAPYIVSPLQTCITTKITNNVNYPNASQYAEIVIYS